MRRTTWVLLAALIATLSVVAWGTATLIERERAALISRFEVARLELAQAAARRGEEDIKQVTDDLSLAMELVEKSGGAPRLDRLLEALIGSVRPYRGALVQIGDGERILVRDPRSADPIPEVQVAMLEEALERARITPGRVETSAPREAEPQAWYRAFASANPPEPPKVRRASVALLVDLRALMEKVEPTMLEGVSEILILGPHGRPARVSSPELAAGIARAESRGLRGLLEAMRGQESGVRRLRAKDATTLGLPPVPAVVGFAPIHVEGGARWSVAVFSSTAALESEVASLVRRDVFTAIALTLSLCLVAAYVIFTSRRAAVLKERLRHASELGQVRELAQKVLDNIPTGVIVLAADGRITALNQAILARLPEPSLGAPLAAALPGASPETLDRVRALVEAAIRGRRRESLHGERLGIFEGDDQYNVHAVPLEPHAPDARALVVLEDVTQVRTLESQLLRAEKLATVGILAAGIAHEIGTPLGVIRGRAEYVMAKLGDSHPQAGGLEIIVQQIDRVTRTIRELLDFSRGKPVSTQAVPVEQMVQTVTKLLEYEAQRRKLSLEAEVPQGLPPVAADGDQLQQVLVNLVMNAFDACSPGGRVKIAVSRPEEGSREGRLALEVIDDGCGIPAENIHRVFDPFFTTKKRGLGTGLGLTMVSQIARSHGAQVEVHREPQGGTRFSLSWPIVEARGEEVSRAV